ncbi:hypothetical protein P3T24_004344 [Paraburkholderia sp. GAS33]|uniref:hypothetical protein n=1 Tax=Paraburkholderia sp. GAS33 TaxID=3035130 RepID=UPI003D1AA43A
MTADEIKALVERLRKHRETGTCMEGTMYLAKTAADALETLALENQRLRADAHALRQELRNMANAETHDWDDPTQFAAWAKSRARHTLDAIEPPSKV